MNSTKFYVFIFYRIREYILTGNLFTYMGEPLSLITFHV